ncbi:MAG TPA: hypothetical protein VG327_09615 [Mycobacterium sp.]|nr:hypothetical protein [Mycobacterium sp.]
MRFTAVAEVSATVGISWGCPGGPLGIADPKLRTQAGIALFLVFAAVILALTMSPN